MSKRKLPKPTNLANCMRLHEMGYKVEIHDGKVQRVRKDRG